jgi:hypothetical protein
LHQYLSIHFKRKKKRNNVKVSDPLVVPFRLRNGQQIQFLKSIQD